MKKIIYSISGLCCLLLGAACQSTGSNATPAHYEAMVVRTAGPAETAENGEWRPAVAGGALRQGAQARTFDGGELEIELKPYGGVLTLTPETAIEIERLGPETPGDRIVAVIKLLRGRILGDTLKLPEGSKVRVKTQGGTFEIP